ncbi:MAG: hypothetical protein J6N81_04455 [Treponema sp.]|nr:hypothetical protein [Treponema sp.]
MRKLFCACVITFCFSLFAQEAEKDLSQDYLAKSSMPVNAVAWTRDGKYFATSWNNSIILWNAGSNTIAAVYSNSVAESSNPMANVISLQFTSDGRYMLSLRDDNTILIHGVGSNTDTTLISGTGEAMRGAVYAGDYRVVLPLDGKSLYESFRLAETGQYIIEEKFSLDENPWALSASPSGKLLLLTMENGDVKLIDSNSWTEISSFKRYTLSRIKPKFASDSVHFLAAENPNTLSVSSITDENYFYTIEEPSGFSYAAEFSSDALKVVAGLNSGKVKIFDIETGAEENSFQLMYGDSAKSLAFSPDDKYVIIGTEKGYIYRWVLNGEDFVPENDDDDNKLQNALLLGVGYGRLNSEYYSGEYILSIGYRNYFKSPFSYGVDFSFGVGAPNSEFPYTYSVAGSSLNAPYVYSLSAGPCIGLAYYNENLDLTVFSEAMLGVNGRLLFNNSLNYGHASDFKTGVYAETDIGLQWHWIRAWGGIRYDTNLHWLGKIHLGVAIPTKSFKNKKQK